MEPQQQTLQVRLHVHDLQPCTSGSGRGIAPRLSIALGTIRIQQNEFRSELTSGRRTGDLPCGVLNDTKRIAAVRNRDTQVYMDARPLATSLEELHERFVARPLHADEDGNPRRDCAATRHRPYPNRGTPPSAPERYLG